MVTTLFPELHLVRDGEPIPGSAGDPATRHAAAWGMVAVIAGLNVALGLLVELFDIGFLRAIGVGWGSVVSGLVYGVLAFFVRRRSLVALALAIGLFVLDGAFMLVAAARAGGSPPVGGLVARIFFLIPMLRGLGAIRELRRPRRPATQESRTPPAPHPPPGRRPPALARRDRKRPSRRPRRARSPARPRSSRLQLSAPQRRPAPPSMTARGSISHEGQGRRRRRRLRPALRRPPLRDRRRPACASRCRTASCVTCHGRASAASWCARCRRTRPGTARSSWI